MNFIPTAIPDVILIQPRVFGDERGFFMETYQQKLFQEGGIAANFVQDNHSGSKKGILRGLHYQIQQTQGKLVRVISGEVFDVAVDIRQASPFFGKWVSTRLSAENKCQLWVPVGFAHGFYVTSDWAEVVYKTTDYYAPAFEKTLLWNDPSIGIEWPIPPNEVPILSEKDARGILLSFAEVFKS